MSRFEGVGTSVEPGGGGEALAGNQRFRMLVTVAMRQVEQSPTHEQGGTIRSHVAEASGEQSIGLIAGQRDRDLRIPQNLHSRSQRFGGEAQRLRIRWTLIAGHVPRNAHREPHAGFQPHDLCSRTDQRRLDL